MLPSASFRYPEKLIFECACTEVDVAGGEGFASSNSLLSLSLFQTFKLSIEVAVPGAAIARAYWADAGGGLSAVALTRKLTVVFGVKL